MTSPDHALERLELCPYCGETPDAARGEGDGCFRSYFIPCSCGARGPEAATPAEAIAAWNSRSLTAKAPAPSEDRVSPQERERVESIRIGEWRAFDRVLAWVNEQDEKAIPKADLYAEVMKMRPGGMPSERFLAPPQEGGKP